MAMWQRFAEHSRSLGWNVLSTWRYGVTRPEVWPYLQANPAGHAGYVVQPGDTLEDLANRWRRPVEDVVAVNGIDPAALEPGVNLCIPA